MTAQIDTWLRKMTHGDADLNARKAVYLLAEGWDDTLLHQEGDLGFVPGDGQVRDRPRSLLLRLELSPE